ncbi:hypothetical protein VIGAN_04270300 [Vigna angularis var. angularis]|uniref:Uncharacterized protein n=1 Tax=Vigna angularis var. angularis TaxID=157739 RepID=A0A0S3RX76_PHAAN|nr:hypothetical protein VIGAN_04270300 [Vigna angularis var. angularis]
MEKSVLRKKVSACREWEGVFQKIQFSSPSQPDVLSYADTCLPLLFSECSNVTHGKRAAENMWLELSAEPQPHRLALAPFKTKPIFFGPFNEGFSETPAPKAPRRRVGFGIGWAGPQSEIPSFHSTSFVDSSLPRLIHDSVSSFCPFRKAKGFTSSIIFLDINN